MIGQINLLERLKNQITSGTLPRFLILVGLPGAGKKLLADWISLQGKYTSYTYTLNDVKVDSIRTMIQDSYKLNRTTFYIIPDADRMSLAAKNALLKVTEEPPNNAYFILTLQDENNTLPTILSRGSVYRMEPYTPNDIEEYASTLFENDKSWDDVKNIVRDLCETPGDVQLLKNNNVLDFYNYVNTVCEHIDKVSGSNSFKIADKIALKNEEDKYDLRLFWKAFMLVCLHNLKHHTSLKYTSGIRITSKALQALGIMGINKQCLFDSWILDIRKEWAVWN